MFREHTALSLRGIYPTTETVDGETRKRVVLEWFIQPFTRELATSLDIARNLYAGLDGNPIDDVVGCELVIGVALQRMQIQMAPDAQVGLVVDNVRVSKTIKVRRDKEGPVLAATFKVDFPYPSPADLLYLFNGYLDQHYVTFSEQQGALGLTDAPADAPPNKPRRGRKPAADAPADVPLPDEAPVADAITQ